MSDIVFDASPLIAILKGEPGADIAASYIQGAMMSTVNYAEVITYFAHLGLTENEVEQLTAEQPVHYVPLSPSQASRAGMLVAQTKPYGLSLGDRCCLALALEYSATVVTADRAWLDLAEPLGLDIVLTRPS